LRASFFAATPLDDIAAFAAFDSFQSFDIARCFSRHAAFQPDYRFHSAASLIIHFHFSYFRRHATFISAECLPGFSFRHYQFFAISRRRHIFSRGYRLRVFASMPQLRHTG